MSSSTRLRSPAAIAEGRQLMRSHLARNASSASSVAETNRDTTPCPQRSRTAAACEGPIPFALDARSFRVRGPHDGQGVLDPSLGARDPLIGDCVRQPATALIEQDHPRHTGDLAPGPEVPGVLPQHLQRDAQWLHVDVWLALTERLIRHPPVTRISELDCGRSHAIER